VSLGRRAAIVAFALGLPAVALVELCAGFATVAPPAEAYEPLVPVVERLYRDGDLVVMAPRWAEPHARAVLGDGPMKLADLARSDVATYPRAIEISLGGEHDPELAAFREVSAADVGPFRVRELENPSPEHVTYDFVDHFGPKSVAVSGTDPEETCLYSSRARVLSGGLGGHPTFPAKRFECAGGAFFGVGVTVIADERFLPRRCIFAHPPEVGARVLRFTDVSLGDRIVVHSGMYWMIERERKGAPVELSVAVDGEPVGTVTHLDGQGWKRDELSLGAHARAEHATVEFAISSSSYFERHFCFEATSR
jgi:hypothetical protein